MFTVILMIVLLWMKLGAGWAMLYLGAFITDFIIFFCVNLAVKALKR